MQMAFHVIGRGVDPDTKKYEDPPAEGGPEPKKSKTTDA